MLSGCSTHTTHKKVFAYLCLMKHRVCCQRVITSSLAYLMTATDVELLQALTVILTYSNTAIGSVVKEPTYKHYTAEIHPGISTSVLTNLWQDTSSHT